MLHTKCFYGILLSCRQLHGTSHHAQASPPGLHARKRRPLWDGRPHQRRQTLSWGLEGETKFLAPVQGTSPW